MIQYKTNWDFKIKCATLNCRGLRDKNKRLSVFQFLKDENIDIAFLQETYVTDNFIPNFNKDWPGETFHAHTDSCHSRGTAILLREGLNAKVINSHRSNDGRRMMINITVNEEEFSLIAAYAPDKNRKDYLKKLSSWVQKHSINIDRTILGADLNTVDSAMDRSSKNLDYSSNEFTKLKKNIGVTDSWRSLNKTKIELSYSHPSGNSKSRIDYVLCSESLMACVKNSYIGVAPVPDHKAVFVELKNENNTRGRGYWKLNNQFLESELYCNNITDIVLNTQKEYGAFLTKRLLWDLCKIRIKEYSIQFGISLSRNTKTQIKQLQNEIDEIDKEIIKNDIKEKDPITIKRRELKSNLDLLLINKAKDAQIRSRAEWVEQGGRSANYFTRLEKQRQTFNRIDSVKNDKGEILISDKEILNETVTFYSNLYSSNLPNDEHVQNYLNNTNLPNILSSEDKNKSA